MSEGKKWTTDLGIYRLMVFKKWGIEWDLNFKHFLHIFKNIRHFSIIIERMRSQSWTIFVYFCSLIFAIKRQRLFLRNSCIRFQGSGSVRGANKQTTFLYLLNPFYFHTQKQKWKQTTLLGIIPSGQPKGSSGSVSSFFSFCCLGSHKPMRLFCRRKYPAHWEDFI